MIATEKLWLTADRERLVPDGHPDAATLFCTPGKRISDEDAARYGLTGAPSEAVPSEPASGLTVTKAVAEHEDKQAAAPEDKSGEVDSADGDQEPEPTAEADDSDDKAPPKPGRGRRS